MRQSELIIGLAFCLACGGAACSKSGEERGEGQEAAVAARDGASGDAITVTGCLTSAADRGAFVVTADRNALTSGALHAGDGETPTYTYELTGNTVDLAQHVGRQVQVSGRLDEDRDDEVKVEDEAKTELPKAQSGDDVVKPVIETETEMVINVRRLSVSSVTQTGRPCGVSGQ